jgi:glycosyltransferase involved in cell wall biosynthesis
MLSVLIETRNDEERLARTLATLIGGVVEGLIRDVIVCDNGSSDQTHRIADQTGCNYVTEGGIAAGIRAAKGDWLLIIEPGARLSDGWMNAVIDHIGALPGPARFSPARATRQPLLRRVFSKNRPLADGLLITKRQALALSAKAENAQAMARGLSRRRLPAEIWVAQSA